MIGKQEKRAYEFFVQAEREKKCISLRDIEVATGYSVATTRLYVDGQWSGFLKECDKGYIITGVADSTYEDFHTSICAKPIVIRPSPTILIRLREQAKEKGCSLPTIVLEVLHQHLLS